MSKEASLGRILGEAAGKLGSSPTGWLPKGGPLMGSLAQGALFGLGGYGAGRLAGALMPGIDSHRLGMVAGLGAAGLPLLHPVNGWAMARNMEEWKKRGQP